MAKRLRFFQYFIAISLLYASSRRLEGSETKLFFHWGSLDGNPVLLEKGRPSGSGQASEINRAVQNQIRGWYESSGRQDLAGPGFYFSSDLFDSKAFGVDLLILEISADNIKSIQFPESSSDRVKSRADKALKSNDWTSTELISRYTKTWHVISREPTSEENQKIQIAFRPPQAKDASEIWKASTSTTPTTIEFLNQLGNFIREMHGSDQITAQSRALFHQIFFDIGFSFLDKLENSNMTRDLLTQDKILNILSAYLAVIPKDPRTSRIIKKYFWENETSLLNVLDYVMLQERFSYLSRPLLQHLRENVQDPVNFFRKLIKHYRQSFDPKKISGFPWLPFQTLFQFLSLENDHLLKSELSSELDIYFDDLKKFDPIFHRMHLRHFFSDFISLEAFKKTLIDIVTEFPDSFFPVLEKLNSPDYTMRKIRPISFSPIIHQLRSLRILDRTTQIKAKANQLLKQSALTEASPVETNSLHDHIDQSIMRHEKIISGSVEYSEILRLFSLIDPLFISEDLRIMNARVPQHRFNEDYIFGGLHYYQPSWENFNDAWNHLALGLIIPKQWPKNFVLTFKRWLIATHGKCMMGYVDGFDQQCIGSLSKWDRKKYETIIPNDLWEKMDFDKRIGLIDNFFSIEHRSDVHILRFKSLREILTFLSPAENSVPNAPLILRIIIEKVNEAKDPVTRAARILHLMSKIHLFENGNGRLARLWASAELVDAGFPIPVGLPTNDFFMDEKEIKLELEKSMELGRHWMNVLRKFSARTVDPSDFFQRHFKGSALEGMIHITPFDKIELQQFILWLRFQQKPPSWAKEWMIRVEEEIYRLRSLRGSIAQTSEIERYDSFRSLWAQFKKEFHINFELSEECSKELQSLGPLFSPAHSF